MIGRFHRQKNHAGFVMAAAQIATQLPDAEFLLCGAGVTWRNAELVNAIQSTGFGPRFHLLGSRTDMAAIHASLDLAVLPSVCGEGFPNVIGESMACGVPCVVTNVGDAAMLVADAGRVVPVGDSSALATACLEVLHLPAPERRLLSHRARQRIAQYFSLPQITGRYAALWHDVVAARQRRGQPK
jgi:glycosyltransferase involved in cell wall biosynthesis